MKQKPFGGVSEAEYKALTAPYENTPTIITVAPFAQKTPDKLENAPKETQVKRVVKSVGRVLNFGRKEEIPDGGK